MEKGNHVAIVGCSNPLADSSITKIEALKNVLEELGLIVEISHGIYESDYADAKTRAKILNDFYRDINMKAIFDVSGGDMANEILPYLDFDMISENPKPFFGYSDLTTVMNAICQKTKQSCVLYQVKNMVAEDEDSTSVEIANKQRIDFKETVMNNLDKNIKSGPLGTFSYKYIQKENMEGIVVGGNIRCLLKLSGTPYFPDVQDKILFLEARSGDIPQMITYISQLRQMGVFDKAAGILLGTFTEIDKKRDTAAIEHLLLEQINASLPVVRTMEIGHATSSKAIGIGEYYIF